MFGSYCQTPSCLSNAKQALCASAGDGVWGLAALFMSFMVRCFGVMRLDTLSVSAPLREKALEACGYVQLFVLCEAGAALTTDPSQCCHYEGSGAHPSALILTPTRSTTKELVTNKLSHIKYRTCSMKERMDEAGNTDGKRMEISKKPGARQTKR